MAEGIEQTAGTCQCPGGTCTIVLNAKGCESLNLTSTVIQIYDHSGGTLQATGTTDGSGNVTLTWTGSSGTYWIVPGNARFTGQNVALVCGNSYTVTFTPAAGYTCLHLCATPVKNTLICTVTTLGTLITTSAGTWSFIYSYNYPGCAGCPPTVSPLQVTVSFSALSSSLTAFGWPTDPFFIDCPSQGGFNAGTCDIAAAFDLVSVLTCPPAFSWTGTITITGASPPCLQDLFCYVGTPINVTLTITE